MDSTIYILTGYTGVGKTRLSLDWAKAHQAEIVSCDSLLFYRNMDIGTAKPTLREQAEVRHHMMDIREVSEQYSISDYVQEVRGVVSGIQSRGKRVLVVGGSGFYLNVFFAPVVDSWSLASADRQRLEAQFESQALSRSVENLRAMNPDGLGDLDVENPRRVLQAWLRCSASGLTLAEMKKRFAQQAGIFDRFEKRLLLLSRPKEELEARVRLRVFSMLANGLVDEVKRLLDLGIEKNPSAATAIGYRETIAFIQGELPGDKLAETIAGNTRKLLKKQGTWFKKFLPSEAVYQISGSGLPGSWFRMEPGKG